MLKVGDWAGGDNGYGVIHRFVPVYYEYWHSEIPADKNVGDKKQDLVVLKRFCSFSFKVGLQTKILAAQSVYEIEEDEREKIFQLLADEKNRRKFDRYEVEDDSRDIVDWDLDIESEKIAFIENAIKSFEGNGALKMTMRDIQGYLSESLGLDIFSNPKYPNCRIQLVSCGLGAYNSEKEMLFERINFYRMQ